VGGSGSEGAAIYLWGYVVEMLMKCAYFRIFGVARHVDTSFARSQAVTLARGYRRRNDHDLNYWVFILERARCSQARPLDPALAGALTVKVRTLASHWNEALRYRDAQPTEHEVHEVLECVEWVQTHYNDLWR
jgi:hypothetical protein